MSNKKKWFCWEMHYNGVYQPKIYHGNAPSPKTGEGVKGWSRQGIRILEGEDYDLSLDELARKYPVRNEKGKEDDR